VKHAHTAADREMLKAFIERHDSLFEAMAGRAEREVKPLPLCSRKLSVD
jgi:hypothetical protein